MQDYSEQKIDTKEVRASYINTIDKLKDQLNRKHEERDVIKNNFLTKGIKEVGNKL